MKLMKRALALALALLCVLPICPRARAVEVMLSKQSVKVDGVKAEVYPYNIDGSNYFKLRDVAYLLNVTDYQFNVEYKENKTERAVYIITGAAYKPVGGEMVYDGDQSATAVKSSQTIYIDGVINTDFTVYNIGGRNYFNLRELASAIGFGVDYDKASNTVLINSEKAAEWEPDITFSTTDMKGNQWTDACFAEKKLTVINLWAHWCSPCVRELPDLQKLSEAYADKGVRFLGLHDQSEEAEDLKKLEQLKVTYPSLRYTKDFDAYMNTGYIPVTIFVDSNGKVIGQAYVGSRSYSEWAGMIDEILNKAG